MDFDACILHPELFSTIAVRLDLAVRNTLLKILNVAHLSDTENQCLRLAIEFGGCGIIAASRKKSFSHLAAACQYLPAVGQALKNMGWNNDQINNAIDFSGIQWCLDSLANQGLRIAVDGTIKHDVSPTYLMTPETILWGQAQKLYGKFSDALQRLDDVHLRDRLATGPPRHLARLNSCTGQTSGKWLCKTRQ